MAHFFEHHLQEPLRILLGSQQLGIQIDGGAVARALCAVSP